MKAPRINRSRQRTPSRRGAVLIAAVLCLSVAMMLIGGMFRTALLERRQMRYEQWHEQARWLAESGIERGVHRARTSADYDGETWTVWSRANGDSHDASVRIRINRKPDGSYRIRAVSEYAAETQRPARVTQELVVTAVEPASEQDNG